MGESAVYAQAPINEDKMGSVNKGDLEVSISFGRFENDSLSWEKWSSFSQNKYLEEVEKCSTPGSVAMKKAYFEAHYKKIAAKKAILMEDQQDQTTSDPLSSDEVNGKADLEHHISNDQCFAEEIMEETSLRSDESRTSDDEQIDHTATSAECHSQLFEEEIIMMSRPHSPCLIEPEEVILVKEDTDAPSIGIQDTTETPQDVHNEIMEKKNIPKTKKESVKQGISRKPVKKTITNKEKNVAKVQKKPVSSPVQKTPQIFTPRVSRPTPTSLTSTMMSSSSRSSTKKGTNPSFQRSINSSTGEKRKIVPSSLHMSLSLDPKKTNSTPKSMTRKSLIMDQMGDKDIVRRAFKTFQIKEEKSSLPNQVLRKGDDPKVPSSVTPRNNKEGSHKTSSVEGKSVRPVSSSSVLRSGDKTDARKKPLKKLDDTSNVKEADKTPTPIRSKSKEEQKELDIKKMRQSLNFKATPLPGFYRGQQVSKNLLNKGDTKNNIDEKSTIFITNSR